MLHEGCRKVATAFNSLFAHKHETVGKSYVAGVIKRHAFEIQRLRNKLKNRTHRQGARGLTYAMDLSFVRHDTSALAILDHGTRALLFLGQLYDRTTAGVLRVLFDVIEKFGKPRFLRTDNERIFTSSLIRFTLAILGIRRQTIDPFCPWQNGRVERLFWTLKERLYSWWATAGVPDDVQHDLDILRLVQPRAIPPEPRRNHASYGLGRSHQSQQAATLLPSLGRCLDRLRHAYVTPAIRRSLPATPCPRRRPFTPRILGSNLVQRSAHMPFT